MHRSPVPFWASKKVCFKCEESKPIDEFYRHPMMADGRLGKCKECAKKDVSENREKHKDYYLAYDRNRPNKEERYAGNKARAKTPAGKQWARKALLRRRKLFPQKTKANNAVSNAIRDGRLIRSPCERCGSNRLIHAHHEDYSKPLDVTWLCRPCHLQRHREMKLLGIKP